MAIFSICENSIPASEEKSSLIFINLIIASKEPNFMTTHNSASEINVRQVIGAAIITAGVGAVVGLGIAQIAAPQFVSKEYQELPAKYPVFGAIAGAIGGACQSAILQLKKQRDAEEAEARNQDR
jgi:hypothetical protein